MRNKIYRAAWSVALLMAVVSTLTTIYWSGCEKATEPETSQTFRPSIRNPRLVVRTPGIADDYSKTEQRDECRFLQVSIRCYVLHRKVFTRLTDGPPTPFFRSDNRLN